MVVHGCSLILGPSSHLTASSLASEGQALLIEQEGKECDQSNSDQLGGFNTLGGVEDISGVAHLTSSVTGSQLHAVFVTEGFTSQTVVGNSVSRLAL